MIPYNKPFLSGEELECVRRCIETEGHLCGDGSFTRQCQHFFEEKLGCRKAVLTSSCTDALEMCAMLADIQPGDEVILPSYTFTSTALAFVRQGARLVFADCCSDHPDMDANHVAALITPHTKAIVAMHYAGVACDMDRLMQLAEKHGLIVIEDAAQALDSYYKGRPLGTIGHLAAFSFHETKNIQCGEGGLLVVNDSRFVSRSEILWEKGTNRAEFFRGNVDKYGWVDTGSSFLPADYVAAFLWGQLTHFDRIQTRRKAIWYRYFQRLQPLETTGILPVTPAYATVNGHIFYLVCRSGDERQRLIDHLKQRGISATFHYQSLHKSVYMQRQAAGAPLPNLPEADRYADCLLRLPLFYDLTDEQVDTIADALLEFYLR